jgi:limonene 1,2-monooxygenase
VFGLDNERARARLEPALNTVVQLLTSLEPITETTDWYELHDAVLQVRPYTQPHMPLAIATGGPEGLRMTGRFGAQLLTGGSPDRVPTMLETMREGAEAAGRTADRHQIWLGADMHLAGTREEAIRQIREGAARERFDFFSTVNGAPAPEGDRDTYAETLIGAGSLVGTPDDAISTIEHMVETSGGFGGILLRVNEWASREARLHSHELFSRYVMPHFQGSLLGPATAAEVASRVNHAREAVTA